MPYEEIQHTADWALHVWAADIPTLFTEAALGMNLLAGMQPVQGSHIQRSFKTIESDIECLLVAFLSELLYLAEQERIMFDQFELSITGGMLVADMKGWSLDSMKKNIKAVTFHNLQVRHSKKGFETEIVFDV